MDHFLYFFLVILILINTSFIIFHDKLSKIYNIYDVPDGIRKYHKKSTPLTGGLIIFINIILIFSFFQPNNYILTLFIFFIVFILGYVDDKSNISPTLKLGVLFFIVILNSLVNQEILINNLRFNYIESLNLTGSIKYLFLAFCIISFVNALNMFDGANLQVSIYSIFLLVVIYLNSTQLIYVYLILPLIFFSILNFKNKSFLGDSGSILIGYAISHEIIKIYNVESIFTCEDIFLLMFLPGIDMTRLFIYRLINKKNPLKPDNEHIHHIVNRKLDKNKSLILIIILTIMPYILSLILGRLISIIISSLFYLFVITNLSKNNWNKI